MWWQTQVCQHYGFFYRSLEFRKCSLFLKIFIRSSDIFGFFTDFAIFWFFSTFFFEYKYIWKDRNTSFSKMRGRYNRALCSDNFNHKKVIIHGYRWAPVSDCIPTFAYCCLWLQTYRIQSNFAKMKQEPQGYNITSDKLEFVRNALKIMWQFLQEKFDDFCRKILTIFFMKTWLCFAEKVNEFWKKI